jgi:hypothetical protein
MSGERQGRAGEEHDAEARREAAEAAWLARLDASIGESGRGRGSGGGRAGAARTEAQGVVAPPVIVMEGVHPACIASEALLRGCSRSQVKTSGPGGQNRNKVQTGIVLVHGATGVAAKAGERRSVGENLPVALRRLRLNLAVLVRCPVALGEARSDLWMRRCPEAGKLAGRIVVATAHEDFPAMLATSLDVLWASGLDHGHAATRLVCTPSQLVRLWKDHMPALLWVNGQREARGMKGLL